jgi:NAD(P)H-dependent flavin oxidoreductase YrpB (nitropropane dioxygenase family)
MRTPLARSLGVEFPIVAFSHCRDVVAAVSQAGGLGVLGAGANPPDILDLELRWIRERVGNRPFGVDFLIPNRYVGQDEGGLTRERLRERLSGEHQAFLDDLLRRYGVPPLVDAADDGRHGNNSHKGAQELLDVAMSHQPKLIANALGPPTPEMVTAAHEGGAVVASLVGRPEHATGQIELGVDVIVAQGYEAGGHTGEIASMVLTPAVVEAVSPTPVLAAGGIATGRQIAAALALGAQGVWTGSVWLTTAEAETSPTVRRKLLEAGVGDTVRSRCSTGKPARQLRTAWTEEWDAPTSPDPLPMPLQLILTAEAKQRIDRAAAAHPGAAELATYYVGQVVGLLKREQTTKQVMQRLIEEYIEAVGQLAGTLEQAWDPMIEGVRKS